MNCGIADWASLAKNMSVSTNSSENAKGLFKCPVQMVEPQCLRTHIQ